jgi:hypothetical protein
VIIGGDLMAGSGRYAGLLAFLRLGVVAFKTRGQSGEAVFA